MTTANWIYVLAGFLWPCCALSFWPRETWLFVRQELELGRVTTGVLMVMSAIGSILTWWLPRLPPLPEKPLRTCERCESLVSPVPLGPEPPCRHPHEAVMTTNGRNWWCDLCDEVVVLRRPQSQAEADELLETGPVWVSQR